MTIIERIGFAHTHVVRSISADGETLLARVAGEALADATLAAEDIDAVTASHSKHGMSAQGFTAVTGRRVAARPDGHASVPERLS